MDKVAKRQADVCLALIRDLDGAVTEGKQPVDQYLARLYRRHREYGSRDRRFFSNAVFSWFRWRGWLKSPEKENIAAAILLDADEIPPQLEYMLEGDGLPREKIKPLGPLTIDEKTECLRLLRFRTPQQSEAATACSRGTPLPRSLHFNYRNLLPPWFFDLVFIPEQREPELHFRQCIEAFQSRPPTWLRLPAERPQDVLASLQKAGLEVESHPLIKQAAFIKGKKSFDLTLFPKIEIQDLASQSVGLCCAPGPGQEWWDVCAGAGGKSLHLADLMRGTGHILATDIRSAILSQLAKRLEKYRRFAVKPLLWDGSSDPAPQKFFDGILIDAPCSGLGTWARNPDARWRTDSGQIQKYVNIQEDLLRLAAGKVRTGGKLVYSVCTLTAAESTDIIAEFLEQHRQFQMEKLINPLNGEPADGTIRIWPWEGNCNGMFIAVMKKT